jgi:hypothetical protein
MDKPLGSALFLFQISNKEPIELILKELGKQILADGIITHY